MLRQLYLGEEGPRTHVRLLSAAAMLGWVQPFASGDFPRPPRRLDKRVMDLPLGEEGVLAWYGYSWSWCHRSLTDKDRTVLISERRV